MHQSQGWTFLSNHAHVLLCLATEGDVRLRDVAARVGITERAVQSIVSDLEVRGAITRKRDGRRNRYEIHGEARLRHPVEAHCTVADLVDMVRRDETVRRDIAHRDLEGNSVADGAPVSTETGHAADAAVESERNYLE